MNEPPATNEPSASWWGTHRRPFAITLGITAVLVCTAAVVVGLDRVLIAGANALTTVVALPFVIAVGLILVLIVPFLPFLLISALTDDAFDLPDGESVVEGVGRHVVKPYFRWIGKQRSPIFWGVPCGLVTALVFLAVVGYVRAAPERAAAAAAARKLDETRALLERVQGELRDEYERTGQFPETVSTVDPYGHALAYVVVESRSKSSYTLTSLGPDGTPSDDDLCVDELLRRDQGVLRRLARRVLQGPEPAPVRCPAAAAKRAAR